MRNIIFTLLTILFFSACEYDSDNIHYKDIEKPKDIQIGVDLAGVNPNDTIYIYANTRLSYSIKTEDAELLKQDFYLDEKYVLATDGVISIYPSSYVNNRAYKLRMNIELKTNSGSIASILGLEKYIGDIYFNVKFVKSDLKLNIKQQKTRDKHLQIVWDKPNLKQIDVDYYEVLYYDDLLIGEQIARISNQDETQFTDKQFVYGYKSYIIKTYFKDSKIEPWIDYYTVEYPAFSQDDFTFENIALDKVNISWKKNLEYACKIVFVDSDNKIKYLSDTDKYVEAFFPSRLPSTAYYKMYILPKDADNSTYSKYKSIGVSYISQSIDYSMRDISYDLGRSLFYELYRDGVNIYDGKLMTLKETIKFPNLVHEWSTIYYSAQTGKIVYQDKEKDFFYIFADNKFEQPDNQYISRFSGMTKNKLIGNLNELNGLSVLDINTNTLLYSIPCYWSHNVSSDGKYVSFLNYDTSVLYVYELKDSSAEIILEKKLEYKYDQYTFDPTNSDLLIVHDAGRFYTINIKNGKKSKEVTGYFISVDPVTGNYLYQDDSYYPRGPYAMIMNPSLDKLLIKQELGNVSNGSRSYLINNYLFFGPYYIDVSKYLKK